jgi:hypothetical protein
MIQNTPDARPWALTIFILCLIMIGLLFWFGEIFVSRKDKEEIKKVGDQYNDIMKSIVTIAQGYTEEPDDMLRSLAIKLREELDKPSLEDEEKTWIQVLKKDVLSIANKWEAQAGKTLPEQELQYESGLFPEDALPRM